MAPFLLPYITYFFKSRDINVSLNVNKLKSEQEGDKVCLKIIVSNSGADNSASRHDSLNLEGSAESREEND